MQINGETVTAIATHGSVKKALIPGCAGKEFAEAFPLKESVDHWMLRGKTEEEATQITLASLAKTAKGIWDEYGPSVAHQIGAEAEAKRRPIFIYRSSVRGVEIGYYYGPAEKWAKHEQTEGWRRLNETAMASGQVRPMT